MVGRPVAARQRLRDRCLYIYKDRQGQNLPCPFLVGWLKVFHDSKRDVGHEGGAAAGGRPERDGGRGGSEAAPMGGLGGFAAGIDNLCGRGNWAQALAG